MLTIEETVKELDRCPICGEEIRADNIKIGYNVGDKSNYVYIVCSCGLKSKEIESTVGNCALEDLIDYWNNRKYKSKLTTLAPDGRPSNTNYTIIMDSRGDTK